MTKTVSIRSKFEAFRAAANAALVGRSDEIDLTLAAMVSREHLLLVGPPGTAKSMLCDFVLDWVADGTGFSILISKFTVPEELFGPVSLSGLKKDEYRRLVDGYLPTATVAFLDEIFKASSAILNTLLKILNERVFINGKESVDCPLRLAVAASNEWPGDNGEGKELGALFDRFVLRKYVSPIGKTDRGKLVWEDHVFSIDDRYKIRPEEIDKAADEAARLPWSDEAKECFEQIIDELAKGGIIPGDRRMVKSVKVARAAAWLAGHKEVLPVDLDILKHVLWDDPAEQPRKAAKTIGRIANPIGTKIMGLFQQAADVCENHNPPDAVARLKEIKAELEEISTDGDERQEKKRTAAIDYVAGLIADEYKKVIGTL